MTTTRRDVTAGLAGAAALAAASSAEAQTRSQISAFEAAMTPETQFNGAPREILQLWPRRPPGAPRTLPAQEIIERSTPPALRDRAVLHVSRPVLIVFRPANPNGAAIVLCTGGGYQRVVLDKEGYESAEWYAARGITTFQLIYRLPNDGWASGANASLQDVQRAIRVVRARATEFSIDPAKVTLLGFSAGGHVAASGTLRFDAPVYERIDAADDQSAKPDASILMYPVITMRAPQAQTGIRDLLLGVNSTDAAQAEHSLETHGRADAPPMFLLHCVDDTTIPVGNSQILYDAMIAAGAQPELHIFQTGGHGFGTRLIAGKPTELWPQLTLNWLKARGLVPT
jgi:acetyl esterase/lipase